MKTMVKSAGVLMMMLVACGGDDPRYRNTEMLERPPTLAIDKKAEALVVPDDSVVPKRKHTKGLQDDVYLVTENPPVMNIKQPFETAWNTLEQALKQSEIRIADQERDKGLYYVDYNPPTLIGAVSSWVTDKHKQVIYVLAVTQDGAETRVTVTKAAPAEQSSALEKVSDEPDDDAADLLRRLFETLRDDWTDG
jgi:uncharacterized lipoprotein